MDAKRIISQLVAQFPGKRIVRIPESDPLEIVVELGGTQEEGLAIAVIDRSVSHMHRKTTEVYEIQEGSLIVHVDGQAMRLEPGQTLTIRPGQVHWAEGSATRLLVRSRPPWTFEDHILVE